MNIKLLFAAFVLVVLGAGWFAGAGATAGYARPIRTASAQTAAVARQPQLDTWSGNTRLGVRATTGIVVSNPAAAAELGKVTLYVPTGYALDPAAQPGTKEGHAFLLTSSAFAYGDLRAADPAAYVNSPQAQACAPGAHAAVWTMHLTFFFSKKTVTVPIYIDSMSSDQAAVGAYELQACLPLSSVASPAGGRLGSRVRDLGLEFTHLTNPTSPAVYVWRAFVSNPDALGNPDASSTYELRSDMPLPAKLALTARLDRRHHRALLTGRLTTPAASVAAIQVGLFRRVTGGVWQHVASTRTSADGSYRFVRAIRKTGTYSTEIRGTGGCNGDSTAPNGCFDETRGAIDSPGVRVVARQGH